MGIEIGGHEAPAILLKASLARPALEEAHAKQRAFVGRSRIACLAPESLAAARLWGILLVSSEKLRKLRHPL
jgi:hypothetical protein